MRKEVRVALKRMPLSHRLTIAEVGLLCSHRHVLELIATNADGHYGWSTNWAIVFEQDATLHPNITSTASNIIKDAIYLADNSPEGNYGFMYLGFKYGTKNDYYDNGYVTTACRNFNITEPFIRSKEISYSNIHADCDAHGTHAYAITRDRAKYLMGDILNPNNILNKKGEAKKTQIDQALARLFISMYDGPYKSKALHNYALGVDLVSPETNPNPKSKNEVQRGMVYQGDMKGLVLTGMGSNLRAAKYFLEQKEELIPI